MAEPSKPQPIVVIVKGGADVHCGDPNVVIDKRS